MTTLKKINPVNIYFFIIAIIILLFNLLFIQLPLLSTLGYEFSAINSLLLVIASGLFSISYWKKYPSKTKGLFYRLVFFLLIPLIVSIIHSLFTMFCSFGDGIIFYLLITAPSILIGSSISLAVLFYIKRFHKLFFIVIILILAFIPITEIYFNPQVYFYSPLIGFFPGNIYDEGLSPGLKLLFHQVIVAGYFFIILFSLIKWGKKIKEHRIKFLVIIILLPILFEFVSPSLGFSTTYSSLDSHLNKVVETKNTILHYDNLNKEKAKLIALTQQYYFEYLKKKLRVNLNRKINVYLFNTREQKKQLFGAGNADVAKPWQYCVYISKESWDVTLKHEMVHIFSAEFGNGILKIAHGFNTSMIEGMAESIDNNADDYTVTELASIAYHNHYKVDISNLFSGLNFFKQNSSLSYTYSGAFFEFLIQNFGIEKVKSFYRDGRFEENFSSDFTSIKNNFDSYLDTSQSYGNQAMADYYFGRLSIIQKVCPRFISDRLTNAWEYLNSSRLNEAEILFKEINQKALNYSALIGLSEIARLKKQPEEAIELLNKNLSKFLKTPYYYNLLLRIGDLYVLKDSIELAKNNYEKLVIENPQFYLTTLAKVRLDLIDNEKIKTYVEFPDSVRFNILLDMNQQSYNYSAIILMIGLASDLKIDYRSVIKIFDKVFVVDSLESSYALYVLSKYILENEDFLSCRKMAALSLRNYKNNPFLNTYQQNFDKANWFFYNADRVSATFQYSTEK